MNDIDEEDYPDYAEYVYDFYRQYDNDVGFKILKNNIKAQDLNLKLNKMKNMVDFGFAVDKIYKKLNEIQSSQPFLSDSEFTLLNADYNINWLRSHAEFLYKFNSILFLPEDINQQGNIKLREICNRLNYTDEQFIKLKKYFFMDIRNALSHANYRYELDEDMKFKYVTWDVKNEVIELDLPKMMLILKKMIKLTIMQGELLAYYRGHVGKIRERDANSYR